MSMHSNRVVAGMGVSMVYCNDGCGCYDVIVPGNQETFMSIVISYSCC